VIELLLGFIALMVTIGVIAHILLHQATPAPVEPAPEEPPEFGWLEERLTRRIVVHTTDGQSVEGLLDRVVTDGLVLSTARYLDTNPPTDLQGEIFLPRARVGFAQFVDSQASA
jgi:hypothetical protein